MAHMTAICAALVKEKLRDRADASAPKHRPAKFSHTLCTLAFERAEACCIDRNRCCGIVLTGL